MRITIAAVGRLKSGPEHDLLTRYARLVRWPLDIREIDDRSKLPVKQRQKREAERLLACCPDGATVIALEERGRTMTSKELAHKVGDLQDSGVGELVFLIGGADGLDNTAVGRADLSLSFGAVTWPHLMVRAMLVEQIYRAQQILAGHPYHRE